MKNIDTIDCLGAYVGRIDYDDDKVVRIVLRLPDGRSVDVVASCGECSHESVWLEMCDNEIYE